MPALLEVRGLQVVFRTFRGVFPVVNDASITVNEREILGLVGETGSGKSVLASAIVNLIQPPGQVVAGTVSFKGRDLLREPETTLRQIRGRDVSLIVQNAKSSLNPLVPVGTQIVNVARVHSNLTEKAAIARAVEMLTKVGIPDPAARFHTYAHQLSGGMAQRVMIAMALCHNPQLLIADEPTNGLDVTIQAQILDLVYELVHELHSAALLITRDLGIVAQYCDSVAILHGARVVEYAPVRNFFRAPSHPYSKRLVSSAMTFPRRTRAHVIQEALGTMSGPSRQGFAPAASPHPVGVRSSDGAADEERSVRSLPRTEVVPEGGKTLIRVENLVKHFSIPRSRDVVQAVTDVSFALGRGESLGLVGESGSGKTTVGRCMLRLVEPTQGRILFRGQDITRLSYADLMLLRPRLQIVFQEPYESLDPRMAVGQIVREPLRLHMRKPRREQDDRAREILEMVGLRSQDIDYYPHQLSAGQQQRVGIARAIATDPEFVVLDEPTSALDPTTRAEIIDLLIELQERFNIAYLYISHDLGTVRQLCTRVGVMYLGKIVEMGATEQIFEHPSHPYTRALLSAIPFPDPDFRREKYVLRAEIPSPIHLPSGCHLHPRCPAAVAACRVTVPQPVEVEEGHWASCIRVHELLSQRNWGGAPVTQPPPGRSHTM